MSHTCHATACEETVPASMWGCRRHWFMVPKAIRDRVWATYRAGQEDDWEPSKAYLRNAKEAVEAVALKEGIAPDTAVYDAFLSAEECPHLAAERTLGEPLHCDRCCPPECPHR